MEYRVPDTPWHVGYAKKKEEDPRRHKARCIHIEDGYCNYKGMKCSGSAHCMAYCENDEENFNSVSYRAVHSNEVWFSDEIKRFCHDRTQPVRWKFLKDIKNCPICNNIIVDYNPIPYLAKICNKCKVLYVNEDVYGTYTADVNHNIGNLMLCLVGVAPPRIKEEAVKTPAKKIQKKKKQKKKNQRVKVKQTGKKNREIYTLGDDPRFKEIFESLKK